MANSTAYKIIFGILLLLGIYYIYSSYGWYSQTISDAQNPNSTIFFSADSFVVNMIGGLMIGLGSILGLNLFEISSKIFGKSQAKPVVIFLLIVLGFYLATLQPIGVMQGILR